MPHPFYAPKDTPPESTFVRLKITDYADRLLLAYRSLKGWPWRNGTGFTNSTLIGYDPRHVVNLSESYPKHMVFIIKSNGRLIAYRDALKMKENETIKDPRLMVREWNVENLSRLDPVQSNHLLLVMSHVLPPEGYWDQAPPYVNKAGELPHFMKPKPYKPFDDSDEEFGPEYYGPT